MAEPHIDVLLDPPSAVIHTALGSGLMAAIMGWLPQMLALLAASIGACYYMICIWESKTVQHWVNNRRMINKAKKVARLKAKEKVIVAQLEALEVVRVAKRVAAEKVEAAVSEAAILTAKETTAVEVQHIPPRA